MKYILSEEEYNTLQSRIQSLESTNKELYRDLAGTKRELQHLKSAEPSLQPDAASLSIKIVGEIAHNAHFMINALGTVTPTSDCVVTFPKPCHLKYVADLLHIEGIIDNISVWIPANIFVGIASLGTVNAAISAKGSHYLQDIIPLLEAQTVVCKSTFRKDFKFGFDYLSKSPDSDYEAASKEFLEAIKSGL